MTNAVNQQVATPYRNQRAQAEMDAELDGTQKPTDNLNNGTGESAQNTPATPAEGQATSDTQESESYKERWVNLKRYHDTTVFELRKENAGLKKELSDSKKLPNIKSEAEIEAFKNKDPEFFAMLESVVNKNGASVDTERFERMERELEETRQEKIFNDIKKAHPDYIEIAASDEFNTWLEEQDSHVKDMASSAKSASAFVRVLDLYKLDTGSNANKGTSTQKADNSNTNSAADAVSTKGAYTQPRVGDVEGRIWTKAEIAKLSPVEYEMFEQDIDTAWREGRVR